MRSVSHDVFVLRYQFNQFEDQMFFAKRYIPTPLLILEYIIEEIKIGSNFVPSELILVCQEGKSNFNYRVQTFLQLSNGDFRQITGIMVFQIFKENTSHLSQNILGSFSDFLIFVEEQNFEEGVFRSCTLNFFLV